MPWSVLFCFPYPCSSRSIALDGAFYPVTYLRSTVHARSIPATLAKGQMVRIQHAESEDQLRHVRALIAEYVAEQGAILGIDFGSKLHSIRDLEDPAAVYTPPGGCILLATEGIQSVGCVALQRVDRAVGEMKRLYVRLRFRRNGIGRMLALAIIEQARVLGYQKMQLDTVAAMSEAPSLYRSLGFQSIEPYSTIPGWLKGGLLFFELPL